MIKYSIVIPLYNQARMVRMHNKLFNRIYQNHYKSFEVLYMDDGSGIFDMEEYRKILHEAHYPYTLKTVKDKGFRVAYAKNRGIQHANQGTEWIIFQDGDTLVDEEWFDELRKGLKNGDKDVMYYGKRYRINPDDMDKGWKKGFKDVCYAKDFRGDDLPDIPPAGHQMFSGANFVMSKRMSDDLGYSLENWIGYGYEDYAHAVRVLCNGYTIKPLNKLIAYHIEGKEDPKPGDPIAKERYKDLCDKYSQQIQDIYHSKDPKPGAL